MPDDKKNLDKRKNDPKEQRKPRNARNQSGKQERRVEKSEETKSAPKVPQKPLVYEDPGPEFYKGLKRETDEILKITEQENAKYKKKEIQSNWSKYEMPIESYEEVEQQDIGADYEKLIQAPLSIGGHFQFKHEKSWDINTGPSLYDKYFDINMDNLSIAISTIPFYERNEIEKTIFSETDIVNMKNRSEKYREKYLNEQSCRMKNSVDITQKSESEKGTNELIETEHKQESQSGTKIEDRIVLEDDIDLDFNKLKVNIPSTIKINNEKEVVNEANLKNNECVEDIEILVDKNVDLPKQNKPIVAPQRNEHQEAINEETTQEAINIHPKDIEKLLTDTKLSDKSANDRTKAEIISDTKVKADPVETKNPVIESPEDLEKWLDDFLDD